MFHDSSLSPFNKLIASGNCDKLIRLRDQTFDTCTVYNFVPNFCGSISAQLPENQSFVVKFSLIKLMGMPTVAHVHNEGAMITAVQGQWLQL